MFSLVTRQKFEERRPCPGDRVMTSGLGLCFGWSAPVRKLKRDEAAMESRRHSSSLNKARLISAAYLASGHLVGNSTGNDPGIFLASREKESSYDVYHEFDLYRDMHDSQIPSFM